VARRASRTIEREERAGLTSGIEGGARSDAARPNNQGLANCNRVHQEDLMSLTAFLVIVLVLAFLFGGGWYWRR